MIWVGLLDLSLPNELLSGKWFLQIYMTSPEIFLQEQKTDF